jgi:hypothetical protein
VYCLYICLFVFMHKLYLFVSSELVPRLYAVSKHLAKQQRRITVLSQTPSTSNVCDGLNCASTDSVPVKLLGLQSDASQRRHVANCRLNKLHFRYLHISTPTSKWPPPIFYYLHQIKSSRKLSHNSHIDINIITYLLTPRSRVLLDKLIGFQLVKKFPAFYGTRRFITAFTSAHPLSLTVTSSIQSIPPHTISRRSTLILSSHLRLGRY